MSVIIAFVGEYDLYPSEGIDYKLEARIVGEDTENAWYHELIAAEYGDIIEVRHIRIVRDNYRRAFATPPIFASELKRANGNIGDMFVLTTKSSGTAKTLVLCSTALNQWPLPSRPTMVLFLRLSMKTATT